MGLFLSRVVFQPPRDTYDRSLPNLHFIGDSSVPIIHFDVNSRCTVLFSHGNAEDLGLIHDSMRYLAESLRCNVIAYEYPGYGISKGATFPTEAGVFAHADTVVSYISTNLKIPLSRVFVYGRSLGTAPAVYIAGKYPVAGCILQSPLLSIFRIVADLRFSIPWLDWFANIDRISAVKCPVLVIHGDRDEVVPFSHGQMLHSLAPVAVTPLWLSGIGHNDIETEAGRELEARLKAFIGQGVH